ncbi:PAS domain S-box protein [Candidatus Woesearchaeota archaeon]|nr:PAS domain S-box protein [Candidatus Woesearchaeota archaeon]
MPQNHGEDKGRGFLADYFPWFYDWIERRRQNKIRNSATYMEDMLAKQRQVAALQEEISGLKSGLDTKVDEAREEGRKKAETQYNASLAQINAEHRTEIESVNSAIDSLAQREAESRADYEKEKARADRLEEKNEEMGFQLQQTGVKAASLENMVRKLGEESAAEKARAETALGNLSTILSDPMHNFSEVLWEGSSTGIVIVDREGKILRANSKAEAYLGMEEKDLEGLGLLTAAKHNPYFGRYLSFFSEYASEMHAAGKRFEPNTFAIEKTAITVMGLTKGDQKGKYSYGFILITPHVSASSAGAVVDFFKNMLSESITVKGAPAFEDIVLNYVVPVMTSHKKSVYISLDVDLIERRSLDSFAKAYTILKNEGAKCRLTDVPRDAAEYLLKHNLCPVIPDDIKMGKKDSAIATAVQIEKYNSKPAQDEKKTPADTNEGAIPGFAD